MSISARASAWSPATTTSADSCHERVHEPGCSSSSTRPDESAERILISAARSENAAGEPCDTSARRWSSRCSRACSPPSASTCNI
ncbi:hypothetical protein [Nannocystis pusilla]|uniref:hypothetical protein n=1 Tax=Nannocystis pusilla TaxID=889268 RepID=UPI003B781659